MKFVLLVVEGEMRGRVVNVGFHRNRPAPQPQALRRASYGCCSRDFLCGESRSNGNHHLKIVVLSPHRDDAAFSLSLSISHWLAVGHAVTILNVFTRSEYAPFSDAEAKPRRERLDYVSALRKREDEAFLAALGGGVKMVDLEVADAPIRLQCDASIVCDMEVRADDPATPQVQAGLGKLLHGDDVALVLPLGLGHHVDHRTARDAALEASTRVPCAFYEELPYAMRDGVRVDLSRFREDASTRLHEELFPVQCHGTHTRPMEWKRRLALGYASQIDAAMADAIANFSHRYHGAERMWANEAWLKIAAREKLSTRQRDIEKEPLPA
jgi:LmbE family N-acetylglucosaminyl deacetylase